jgi:hypothetical protein
MFESLLLAWGSSLHGLKTFLETGYGLSLMIKWRPSFCCALTRGRKEKIFCSRETFPLKNLKNVAHAQDEGVSLSATPGSSLDGGCGNHNSSKQEAEEAVPEDDTASLESHTHAHLQQQRSLLSQRRSPSPELPESSASNNGSPIVHHPQLQQQQQQQLLQQNNSSPLGGGGNNAYNHQQQHNNNNGHSPADRSTPLLNRHPPPLEAPPASTTSGRGPVPLTSPRTHLRETTKDMVTAVTTHHHQLSQQQHHRHHHHDVNGLTTNAVVSTVALKDIDVQMTALSGYETYV